MYEEQKVLEAASRYQDACFEAKAAEERAAEAEIAADEARAELAVAKLRCFRAADDLLCAVNGETPRYRIAEKDMASEVYGNTAAAG